MRSRRALALLAVALVAFMAQASCVSLFGVEEEGLHDVFKDMCQCAELQALNECEETLGERFDNASPDTRAAWLEQYDRNDCSSCAKVLTCLSATPTCSVSACSRAEECCPMGATQATCGEDHACHR